MAESQEAIILYTSNYCGHSIAVRRLLEKHHIPVEIVTIDGDKEARQRLIELNGGYASVPTLLFPDGSKLTEPSLSRLRQKLGIEETGLVEKVRRLFGSNE